MNLAKRPRELSLESRRFGKRPAPVLARRTLMLLTPLAAVACFGFALLAQPPQTQQAVPSQPGQGQSQAAAQSASAQGSQAAAQSSSPTSQPRAQTSPAAAESGPADPTTKRAKEPEFRPRLPMYYAKVVDEKQRQKIYEIQRKYHPQIVDLQKQLEKLIAQRDAEIEAVLTPQQKAEIEKLRQEAATRRSTKSSSNENSERDSSSQK